MKSEASLAAAVRRVGRRLADALFGGRAGRQAVGGRLDCFQQDMIDILEFRDRDPAAYEEMMD